MSANTDRVTTEILTVSIKVLVVDRKKMTQALFRQIRHEQIIDLASERLRGKPWGWVKYFWDGCWITSQDGTWGDEPRIHVLWQDGEHLCRCPVGEECPVFTPHKVTAWKKFYRELSELEQLFIAVG